MKAKINIKNIISYITGNIRYYLFYSKRLYILIPKHIREQINMRIEQMDQDCYNQGSCLVCGCETPHLQMADKACDKPCYPTMMNREDWKRFKKEVPAYDSETNLVWWIRKGKLENYKSKGPCGNQN